MNIRNTHENKRLYVNFYEFNIYSEVFPLIKIKTLNMIKISTYSNFKIYYALYFNNYLRLVSAITENN